MSIRYRDASGQEVIAAGLTPGGDIEAGAVMTRTGIKEVTNIPAGDKAVASITFDTPMPDDDYLINIEIENATSISNIIVNVMDNQSVYPKTANGFYVTVKNLLNEVAFCNIKYVATKTYTVQHAVQNAEDIANIKAVIPPSASSTNQLTPKKYVDDADTALDGRVSDLEDLVPNNASVTNQLATKSDVDDAETEAQSRLKVVSVMPATPTEGTVVLYIGSDTGLTPGGIYQYQSGNWVLISTAEIDVDSSIDSTSENPVQNKVIAEALDGKQNIEFIGTTAEWNALTTEQKNKYTLVNLTDDKEALGVDAVDVITDGDMRPITSNAVFDAFGANSLGKRYNPYREWVTDGSIDLNDVRTPGPYGNYLIRSATPNGPGFYGYLVVFKWSNTSNVTQVVVGYNVNKIAMRYYVGDTWSSWKVWA